MILGTKFYKRFTFLLFITSLLNTGISTIINIGGIQLTLCRALILLSPFIVLDIHSLNNKFSRISYFPLDKKYIQFLLFWIIYSLLIIPIVTSASALLTDLVFLYSALAIQYLISFYIRDNSLCKKYLWIIFCITIIYCVIGIYEMNTGNYICLDEKHLGYYNESALVSTLGIKIPIATFSNPNNYSFFLLLSFFLTLTLYNLTELRKFKWILITGMCLITFSQLSTQSRSGAIAQIVGLTIYLLGIMKIKRINFVFVSLIFGFFLLMCYGYMKEVIEPLFEIDFSSGSDKTRSILIKGAFNLFLSTFGIGVELGNIELHISEFAKGTSILNVHNFWMEILASSGILVFLGFIIVYLKAISLSFKSFLNNLNIQRQKISLSLFAGLTSCILGFVSSSSLFKFQWFWSLFGLLIFLICYFRNIKSQNF